MSTGRSKPTELITQVFIWLLDYLIIGLLNVWLFNIESQYVLPFIRIYMLQGYA